MILVDSSVWIDYLNNQDNAATERLDEIIEQNKIIIGDLILTEVLQGIHDEHEFKKVCSFFSVIECKTMLGYDICLQSAKHYRYLRTKGITVRKTIDCIIATFCIKNKISLLHNDKDFIPFEQHLALSVA